MPKDKHSVWDLIERFRRSDYFEDVLGHLLHLNGGRRELMSVATAPDRDIGESLKALLLDRTMLKPKTVDPILKMNPVGKIRAAIKGALDTNQSPEERFECLVGLKQAGPFFASTVLDCATDGECIVFEDTLLEGARDMFPDLCGELSSVKDTRSYFDFMAVCRTLKDAYGFRSYAELHEFLWHGHDTAWTFRPR